MSTTYTGIGANVAQSTSPTETIPADGDPLAATSVTTPLKTLMDHIALLWAGVFTAPGGGSGIALSGTGSGATGVGISGTGTGSGPGGQFTGGATGPAIQAGGNGTSPSIKALGSIIQAYSFPTYSASISINAANGNYFGITATNGTAFTINLPTNPVQGQRITINIANTSGGAMGAITWNAGFHLAGAFANPATGNNRSIDFYCGSVSIWYEISRSAADVAN